MIWLAHKMVILVPCLVLDLSGKDTLNMGNITGNLDIVQSIKSVAN